MIAPGCNAHTNTMHAADLQAKIDGGHQAGRHTGTQNAQQGAAALWLVQAKAGG